MKFKSGEVCIIQSTFSRSLVVYHKPDPDVKGCSFVVYPVTTHEARVPDKWLKKVDQAKVRVVTERREDGTRRIRVKRRGKS